MVTVNEYEAWSSGKKKVATGQAAFLVENATATNPDQHASDIALGRSIGVPAALAAEGRDIFNGKLRQKKNELLLGSSPTLARWLSTSDNALVAHDDLDSLSWFEGFTRGASNVGTRAVAKIEKAEGKYFFDRFANRAATRKKTFGQIYEDEGEDFDGVNVHSLGDVVSAAGKWLDARAADAMGIDDVALAQTYAKRIVDAEDAAAAAGLSQSAQEFQTAASENDGSLTGTLQSWLSATASNPMGAILFGLELGGESAPILAASLATTAVTRNPHAGLAVSTAGGFAIESQLSASDFLAEKGIDLRNPVEIERLVRDPALLEEAAKRGVIRGGVIAAADALSMGIAGKALAKNPVTEAMAQAMQQAILGATGEYAARLAAGQDVDFNEVLAEGFAELATTPVELGIAGRKLLRDKSAARLADADRQRIEALATAAQGSKLKQRPGGKFEEWLKLATKGKDVEDVHVPADVLQTYFQTNDIEPNVFFRENGLELWEDYQTAVVTGGDVRIPTATYAARIVGTDLDPVLRDNMRFNPENMTLNEAKEFNGRVQSALEDAYDAHAREMEVESASAEFEDTIKDTMTRALRVAGNSADVARGQALVWSSFYKALAQRSLSTASELAGRFPLPKVSGYVPEGMALKNVDELTRRLAEARAYKPKKSGKRTSLLEFIDKRGGITDVGGELKSRDALIVKRGRRNLKVGRAYVESQGSMFGGGADRNSLSDIAQAAIDEGFLENDPVVAAYKLSVKEGTAAPDISAAFLDAIDRELSGKFEYVGGPVDPSDDAAMRFNDVEEYLARLGLDLSASDDVIRAEIAKDQATVGNEYRQSVAENAPIQDPLSGANGEWRDASVAAVLEDGSEVQVNAGDAADLIQERLKAAQEVFDCVSASAP